MTPKRIFRWATLLILILAALVGGVFEQAVATAPTDFSCTDVSEIPQAECEALVALYASTDGDNWITNDGWLVTTTPCSWYQVWCDDPGHVTQLSPRSNRLMGSIPPELGNLAHLQDLDLSSNLLTGSIPPEFDFLDNLVTLKLSFNQLTGTPDGWAVPPELGNMASLATLYLDNNQLTGSIPPELGNLTSLVDLYLALNQLTGTPDGWAVPPELGNLASLEWLSLPYNQLTGSIPPELGNLTNLERLFLYDNQLTGSIPPELGDLTSLTTLYLDNNQLTGSIPPELGNLTSLATLNLDNNQLTGSIPPELGNLTNLVHLHLTDNQLTGTPDGWAVPPQLGNMASLLVLRLDNNQLTGSIPPELGNLTRLVMLRLSNNPQLAGPVPVTLIRLSLQSFWFNDTSLCEPPYLDFQAWLAGIPDLRRTGVLCTVCSFTVALQEQANSRSDLQTLRRFRDEVLAVSPAGQRHIDRYYRHSPEIAWLLLKDAGLRAGTARLLHELMPGFRATLKEPGGQEVILTAARVKRINVLLDDIAQRASPELQIAIEQLQAEIVGFEGRPLAAMWLSAAP